MMQNAKKFQKSDNQREEEDFFQFEIPYGGLIVFDDTDPDAVIENMLDNYAKDPLIPMLKISDPEDPYLKEMQANRPEQFQDKDIRCIILPMRYKKVFKA